MNLARRKFFGAAAAAPLAAKTAIDTAIAEAMKVDVSGLGPHAGPGMAPPPGNVDDYKGSVISASKYVRLMGFPDFMERELRDSARFVYALDHDIAVKKSWSMAVKLQTQRERNFERAKQGIHNDALRFERRGAFKKLTGWDWPW